MARNLALMTALVASVCFAETAFAQNMVYQRRPYPAYGVPAPAYRVLPPRYVVVPQQQVLVPQPQVQMMQPVLVAPQQVQMVPVMVTPQQPQMVPVMVTPQQTQMGQQAQMGQQQGTPGQGGGGKKKNRPSITINFGSAPADPPATECAPAGTCTDVSDQIALNALLPSARVFTAR